YEAKIKYWTQRIKDALLQFQDINNKLLIDGKNIDQRIKTNPNSKSEEDYFKEQEDSFQKEMDLADKKINDKIAKEKEMQLQQTKNSESIAKGLEIVDSIEKAYFDKRMNRLDTEIEANKKAQSDMKALADKGNETAIKNLAFEEQQGIKLQAQKEKDQKTKERIEMVMALLKTYNSLMAQPNMTPEEALRKTALSGVMLEGMTKAIGSFYEGTIDTGTTNNPLDKNGGRLSILHDNEIVMPEKEATPLRNMGFENTLQIANAAALYKQQTANNKITTDGNYNYLLAAEIKGLREDMAKRPVLDNVMIDKLNQSVIYSMQVKNSLILNHKKLPKY
ncbi:MAG: hypothetical protein NTW06_04170, partial [Candidatus Falkowbacteria bacterium]|nr:hypothetical protein [Candidatus Falkowbacteria bacterium]